MFPITNGVRQGDALSSILFDLVLEAILQKMNITGHIGKKGTQILVYVDDVAIMSRSKNALKDALFNIVAIMSRSKNALKDALFNIVAIMSRSKNALKDALFNIEKEARRRGLLVNENKTKYMQVAGPVLNDEHLCCGKYNCEHVKEFSYLGSQMN